MYKLINKIILVSSVLILIFLSYSQFILFKQLNDSFKSAKNAQKSYYINPESTVKEYKKLIEFQNNNSNEFVNILYLSTFPGMYKFNYEIKSKINEIDSASSMNLEKLLVELDNSSFNALIKNDFDNVTLMFSLDEKINIFYLKKLKSKYFTDKKNILKKRRNYYISKVEENIKQELEKLKKKNVSDSSSYYYNNENRMSEREMNARFMLKYGNPSFIERLDLWSIITEEEKRRGL